MKKNESKWGLVIQYLEKDEYLSLNKIQTEELLELRSLKVYVDKLNNTIERDLKMLQKLQKGIKERKEKVRVYKLKGKPLFERLEHLKNQHEIVVYYTEGVHKRKKVEEGQNGRLVEMKKRIETEYKQINLKYRSIHLSKTKTVYLKPRRSQILDDLELVCPKWYENVGKGLRSLKDSKIENVRNGFVDLFTPVLRELITEKGKEINDKEFSITYKVLLEKLKEKGL
ncbi:MAG: hypothetical protein ACKOX3_02140 [Bacteroidota bacterium]